MSPRKSGGKSGGANPPGGFKKGKDPRRGKGPPKGSPRAGRPPDKFRELMRGIASREAVLTRLRKLTSAQNNDDDLFLKAFEKVCDRGYSRVVDPDISIPIDEKNLTEEQLLRIANGENPLLVLATTERPARA